MGRSDETPFLDLEDAGLAGRVAAAGIAQGYQAGVLDNLRTLQGHARRVAEALAADPDAPAAPATP
jgi:hypothetical protein